MLFSIQALYRNIRRCVLRAGLFDVSHMGEIMVEGKAAGEFIQRLITNDISRLKTPGSLYSYVLS